MSNPHSGSGTPSPIPYTDHVTQYTQSAIGGGYATSAVRPGSSGPFSVTDPYYREYFTTVTSGAGTPEPAYSGQLRQTQIGYGDEAVGGGSTASFVERYVRQSSAYHGKGVIAAATAAGLTVDLPSPDSGIGADAITPRDQNTMQQVSTKYQSIIKRVEKKIFFFIKINSINRNLFVRRRYSLSVFRLYRIMPNEYSNFGPVIIKST